MSDNIGYIVAAYGITWIVLVGYALRLHRVSRRAQAEFGQASQEGGDRE
ncbi:MAG TPA: CcmD family protein [Gemmatimonadaceae bacterium]